MSAFTEAFLFFGLFTDAGASLDPYDVRDGVTYESGGLVGTLTSPATGNVLRGIQYGGSGNQYIGTLVASPPLSGNSFVNSWIRLYDAQTRRLGVQILTTVSGYASNAPAIISEVDLDNIFIEGGHAEAGGWNLQMRLSDLSGDPPKGTVVTCNGEPQGLTLEVLNFKRNNGIGYCTVVDFAAVTK